MMEQVAETIAQVAAPQVRQKVFRTVHDRRAVEEKVKEGFLFADPNITTTNFRAVVSGGPNAGEAVVVKFGEYVFSEGVVKRLDQMGLRPGLPSELVDLSKSHPDSTELAVYFPLVALGDSWEGPLGNLLVVYLLGEARSHGLNLHWRGGGWDEGYSFLAFSRQ